MQIQTQHMPGQCKLYAAVIHVLWKIVIIYHKPSERPIVAYFDFDWDQENPNGKSIGVFIFLNSSLSTSLPGSIQYQVEKSTVKAEYTAVTENIYEIL